MGGIEEQTIYFCLCAQFADWELWSKFWKNQENVGRPIKIFSDDEVSGSKQTRRHLGTIADSKSFLMSQILVNWSSIDGQ